MDRKKWNNFELVIGSTNGSTTEAKVKYVFENTDAQTSQTTHVVRDDGVSIRGRIGNYRAYGAQADITNETGRMQLNQFKIAGALTFRSQNKAE